MISFKRTGHCDFEEIEQAIDFEITAHGDLLLYRIHPRMIPDTKQIYRSIAAGKWDDVHLGKHYE